MFLLYLICLCTVNNVNGENGPIIDQMREEILVEVKNELQMQNRVFWTRFEERESEAKREKREREKVKERKSVKGEKQSLSRCSRRGKET